MPEVTKSEPTPRELAKKIVKSIMQSGESGPDADHLNLYKDGNYLSGWARKPLINHITSIIERELNRDGA